MKRISDSSRFGQTIARATLVVMLGFLALIPRHADAFTYCVANASDFDSMLTSVYATSPSTDIDIRLRPGTYSSSLNPSATGFYMYIGFSAQFALTYSLKISGGWNAGCTLQAAPGGPPTIIDGLGTREILFMDVNAGVNHDNVAINVDVNQIEFYRPNGANSFAAVQLGVTVAQGDVHMSYCKVRNGSGGTQLFVGASLTFTMHDCLFEGNVQSSGSASAMIYAITSVTSAIFNNTFRNNTVPTLASGHASMIRLGVGNTAGSGVAAFENNIVAGNTLCATNCYALEVDGLGTIKYDLIDSNQVYGTPLSSSNNVSGAPNFVNATGAEIAHGSAAENKGRTSAVAGLPFDIAGDARVQGSAVDIGAFEISDVIFMDGFQ